MYLMVIYLLSFFLKGGRIMTNTKKKAKWNYVSPHLKFIHLNVTKCGWWWFYFFVLWIEALFSGFEPSIRIQDARLMLCILLNPAFLT